MVDLDELERLERAATPGPWSYRMNPHGGARVQTGSVGIADVLSRGGVPHPVQEHCEVNARLIATARNALPDLLAELRTLRARVAELEEENEQLRWARRASCVRTPTPGCDCPGCETARERSAQADLVASYEAELEEDRQAERDRILGARVREIASQHDARLDMYLRDRLAEKVIQGLLANPSGPIQANGMSGWGLCNCTIEQVADFAWHIADHMLKARGGSDAG